MSFFATKKFGIGLIVSLIVIMAFSFTCLTSCNGKSQTLVFNDEEIADPFGVKTPEKIKSEFFSIEMMKDTQLVKGFIGHYYIVDLKCDSTTFKFDEMKHSFKMEHSFKFDNQYYQFVHSFEYFVEEVIDQILRDGGTYYLFIRGKPDRLPFENDRITLGFTYYHTIEYIPKTILSSKYMYDLERISNEKIGGWITNEDLALLRAKYVQDFIIRDDFNDLKGPFILEGTSEDIDSDGRNIEIIVYLKQ